MNLGFTMAFASASELLSDLHSLQDDISEFQRLMELLKRQENEVALPRSTSADDILENIEIQATHLRQVGSNLSNIPKIICAVEDLDWSLPLRQTISLRLLRLARSITVMLDHLFSTPIEGILSDLQKILKLVDDMLCLVPAEKPTLPYMTRPLARPRALDTFSPLPSPQTHDTLVEQLFSMLNIFLDDEIRPYPSKILIVGSQGSGKSFLCRAVERGLQGQAEGKSQAK